MLAGALCGAPCCAVPCRAVLCFALLSVVVHSAGCCALRSWYRPELTACCRLPALQHHPAGRAELIWLVRELQKVIGATLDPQVRFRLPQ